MCFIRLICLFLQFSIDTQVFAPFKQRKPKLNEWTEQILRREKADGKKYTLNSSSQRAHTISEYEREREWGRIKIYKCITEINVEKNNNN